MKNHPHIIALTGFATAGKDAVGKILVERFGFVRVAFADEVKAEAFNGWTLRHDVCGFTAGLRLVWSGAKDPEGRRVLQAIGEDGRLIDPAFWIRRALATMDKHRDRSIVITDCRYHNEWSTFCGPSNARGGVNWRVLRPDTKAANQYISETDHLTFDPDATIHNTGTLDDLAETVAWHMADLSR